MPPAPGCHLGPVPWRGVRKVRASFGRRRWIEERGVFDTGVDEIRIGVRRFQMPDALEFPGMLRAVIKLVGGQRRAGFSGDVVLEFVALALGHSVGRFVSPGGVPGWNQVFPPSSER